MTGLEGNGPNCGQVDSPRDAFEAIIGDLLVGDALGFGGLLDGSRDQIAAFLTTGDDDSCFEWVESPASDENPFEVTCHLEPFGRDRVGTDGTGDLRHIDHSDQAPHQGLGPDSRVLTDGGHQVDIHKVVVHRRGNEPPKGKRPTAPYRVDLDTFSASTGGRGSVELGLSYEIEDQTAQLVAVAPANDDALEPAHLPSIGAGNEFVADLPFVQEVESFVGGADEVGEANELVTDGGETVSGLECAHCGHEHPDDYLDEGPPRCDKCGAYGEPSVRDVLSDGGKDLESASTVHLLRQAAQLIREVRERPTSPTNDPEVSVDAALAKSEFTIRGIAAAAEEGAGYIDGDIDTSLITDGGLPESFDEFADPRSDRDPVCDGCGDRVAREYMDGGFCIGCRLRGRDEELVTDGGVVTKEYLDAILRKESTTPLDERRRCPDCEQANLASRKPDTFASTKPRAKWYCGTCCEPVEEPLEPGDEDYPELQTDGGTDRAWGQIPDGEVREAIEQLVDERGPYFNACDLAPKLGISPHAAGHLLGSRDDVEAWGYSRNATTWHYVGADRELVSDGGRDQEDLGVCATCDLGGAADPSPATTTYGGRPMCESHAHMEAAGALEEIVDILEGIDWRHVEGMSPEEASALAGRLMDAQHQTNQAAGYLGEHREVAMDGGTSWSGLSALERDVILAVRRLNTQVVDTTGAAITRQVTHDPDAERSAKSVYLALDHLVTMGLLEREPLDGRASCYECTAEAVDIAHEHFEAGRELFSDGGDPIATIGGEGR